MALGESLRLAHREAEAIQIFRDILNYDPNFRGAEALLGQSLWAASMGPSA